MHGILSYLSKKFNAWDIAIWITEDRRNSGVTSLGSASFSFLLPFMSYSSVFGF